MTDLDAIIRDAAEAERRRYGIPGENAPHLLRVVAGRLQYRRTVVRNPDGNIISSPWRDVPVYATQAEADAAE